MENLGVLDLSDCNIVSGGSLYYRNDNSEYYTTDNILGSYSIRDLDLDSISYPRVSTVDKYAVGILGVCSHLYIPASVISLINNVGCHEYTFEYGDEELSVKQNIISGARKVSLGRFVTYDKFFQNVSSTLEEVQVTYPYTELKDEFFYNCSKLTSFRIPESMQAIGRRTFYGCTGLRRCDMLRENTAISECEFVLKQYLSRCYTLRSRRNTHCIFLRPYMGNV